MFSKSFATVAALTLGLMAAQSAQAAISSDGSIFLETFTGNMAPFDEGGSAFTGPDISFSGSNSAHIVNTNPSDEGAYQATGFTAGPSGEYAVEIVFSHNGPLDDLNGDGTGITRGILFRAFNAATSLDADINLIVKDNIDGTTWDISVMDAVNPGNGADGGTLAGLSLARNQFHTIVLHHKGNVGNEIDLYVDDSFIGTYIDRSPGADLGFSQVGNISSAIGFTNSYLDSFSIGAFVPEPASLALLGMGGLMLLRRRH